MEVVDQEISKEYSQHIKPTGYGPEYKSLIERGKEHWKTRDARLRKEASARSKSILEEGEKMFMSEKKQ